ALSEPVETKSGRAYRALRPVCCGRESNSGRPERARRRKQSCENSPYNWRSKPVNLKRKTKGTLRSYLHYGGLFRRLRRLGPTTDGQDDCRRTKDKSAARTATRAAQAADMDDGR